MVDMLETRLVWHVRRDNGMRSTSRREVFGGRGCLVVLLIICFTLTGEVFGAFMFVGRAELDRRKAQSLSAGEDTTVDAGNNTHIDIGLESHACHTTKTRRVSCCDRR